MSPKKFVYSLYPGYDMMEVAIANLPKRTCKTQVSIYRKHVIAQIKPSSNTRIDFGLALKDAKFTRRRLDTGGQAKKDRITHRIEITSIDQIDDDVRKRLKRSYELDA